MWKLSAIQWIGTDGSKRTKKKIGRKRQRSANHWNENGISTAETLFGIFSFMNGLRFSIGFSQIEKRSPCSVWVKLSIAIRCRIEIANASNWFWRSFVRLTIIIATAWHFNECHAVQLLNAENRTEKNVFKLKTHRSVEYIREQIYDTRTRCEREKCGTQFSCGSEKGQKC